MKRIEVRLDILKERYEALESGPWHASIDSCDCGDGYGCSHGSWVHEIWRADAKPHPSWKPDSIRHKTEKLLNGQYKIPVIEDMHAYVEVGEFAAFAREDIPALEKALRIAVEALSDDKETLRAIGKALSPITRHKW